MKIKLNDIIKNILISDEDLGSPFVDSFDKVKFLDKVDIALKENEVIDVEQGVTTMEALFELNDIYGSLMLNIEELVDKINLDKNEFIENIFAATNLQAFSAYNEMLDGAINTEKRFVDVQNLSEEHRIKNVLGNSIKTNVAFEASVDICNLLIEIVSSFDPEKDDTLPNLEKTEQLKLLHHLMLCTSIIFSLETAFHLFKYEYHEIKKEENKITFKQPEHPWFLLKIVGDQRYTNLTLEYAFSIPKLLQQSKDTIPELTIQNNEITIGKEEVKSNSVSKWSKYSDIIAFSSYLEGKKIKQIGNIDIMQIATVIIELQHFFQSIHIKNVVKQAIDNQDLDYLPFKIKKANLINHLSKKLKIKKIIVSGILSKLTSNFRENNTPDLWQTPLIHVSDYYYFLFPSIAQSNLSHLIDTIIGKSITEEEKTRWFRDFVAKELTNFDKGYKFDVFDRKKTRKALPGSNSQKSIIIQTKSKLLLFEVCILNFPLHSPDYGIMTSKLAGSSLELDRKKELLTKYIETEGDSKNIIGIVLTNYTSLSGLNIGNNHVLDFYLVKNYFITGKLGRGKVTAHSGMVESKEMSAYEYYHNEEEFNANLESFLSSPYPIIDKVVSYVKDEELIVPEGASPQIFQEVTNIIPLEERILEKFKRIEYSIRQLHYFKNDLEIADDNGKQILENTILYDLPLIFNLLVSEKDRSARVYIADRLKANHLLSFAFLTTTLHNQLIQLFQFSVDNNTERSQHQYSNDTSKKLGEILQQNLPENGGEINPWSMNLKHDFDQTTINEILELLLDQLKTLGQKNYTQEELDTYSINLALFANLSKGKDEYKRELYSVALNFIEALHFNNHYQKTRDFCETLLEFSLNEERIPLLGWFCLFKCYIKQQNAFQAAFYGNMFFSALTNFSQIDKSLFVDMLYHSLLFFRNFGFSDIVEDIFKVAKKCDLEGYDDHKITLSYFFTKLKWEPDKVDKLVSPVAEYLEQNIEDIINYGDQAMLPWFAFLTNLKELNEHQDQVLTDFSQLEAHYANLKSKINEDLLTDLELKFNPTATQKKLLKEALIKVFETRSFGDFSSELSDIERLVNTTLRTSIATSDFEGLLLCGLTINDHYLTFQNKTSQMFAPLFSNNSNIEEYINNYYTTITDQIQLKENQVIIWLFEVDHKVYALRISHDKSLTLTPLPSWDYPKMKLWINKISDFVFEDKRGGVAIEEQEQEYIKTLDDTNFAMISGLNGREILLCTSLELAEFPHNLLQVSDTQNFDAFSKHEEIVKNHIIEQGDFISFNTSITNILSLDWFCKNGNDVQLSQEQFNIEAWIPLDDEPVDDSNEAIGIDTSIHIGNSKLESIIKDTYNGVIHNSILPEDSMDSTINVLLVHGDKGLGGFTTLYTKQEGGKAIVKQEGIERIFGAGQIAVLFVCHSASITKEVYAQTLNSFVNLILKKSYKAVVASPWALNTDIAPVWLKEFLRVLKAGESIGKSVLFANQKVAKEGYDDYFGFYSPSGWAAMHLYGNPNICFVESNSPN